MGLKGWLLKLIAQRQYKDTFDPKKIKKVLVIRNGRIGDVICMFPMLREMKKAFPHFEIDVYAGVHSNFMFNDLTYVHNVYTKYKKREFVKTWLELFKMRQKHYDLVIDTMELRINLVLSTLFLSPKWVIGNKIENRYGIQNSELSLYYKLNTHDRSKHIVDELLEYLSLIGVQHYSSTMEFYISQDMQRKAYEFCHQFGKKKLIGINVDASSLTRTLYEEQILELSRKLNKEDVHILLFSLPSRRTEIKRILQKYHIDNAELTYVTNTIFDVAALIDQLDVLISPDTSLVHIASAINKPLVAIYRDDDEHIGRWGPRNTNYYIVKSAVIDANSIEGFSIDDVVEKSLAFLNHS